MARARRRHLPAAWALLLAALALNVVRAQERLDASAAAAPREAQWFYMPPPEMLRALSMGYEHAVADWFWIKAMWFIGAPDFAGADYRVAARMLDAVTDLKPDFYYIYRLGGSILGFEKEAVPDAVALLEKGAARFPNDWFLPFLAGFNWFYHLGDGAKAAPFLERASGLPGAPSYLRPLAARLYARADDKRAALALLAQVAAAEPDPDRQEKYAERIRALQAEIAAEERRKSEAEPLGPPAPETPTPEASP